jgi:hemerythrin
MTWQERFRLGVVPIDVQHRVLMDLTNKLHKAAAAGEDSRNIQCAMDELMNYVLFHFAFEEKLMADNGYPEFEEHRHMHEELLDQFRALQADVAENRLALNDRVMNFLQGWLIHHIVSSDRELVAFTKAEKPKICVPTVPI